MLISCWSPKGGSGTTVIAAALAMLHAQLSGSWLVDTQGDLDAVFPTGDAPATAGFRQWSSVINDARPQRLADVAYAATSDVTLIPAGPVVADAPRPSAQRIAEFAEWIGDDVAIVDAGTVGDGGESYARLFSDVADHSYCVVRLCFLSLRRLQQSSVTPTGLIIIDEPNRMLAPEDFVRSVHAPVIATIPWDASISRSVNSGTLGRAMPKQLVRALGRAA